MLSVDEAVSRITARIVRAPAEEVALHEALGRTLASDLVSGVDLPPWDNSAMDGWAVRAADVPGTLPVLGVLGAGSDAALTVLPGTAVGIMTGAPLPPGADAVVMVEDSQRIGEAVALSGAARPGQHVRRRGSDVRQGQRLLAAGETLTPAKIGVIAAIGQPTVSVARRPVVAILATGDELVPPGQPLGPGQIWSSNNVALAAMVRAAGGVPVDCGACRDTLADTVDALERALATGADAVLTTGGVSVGEFDFVKEAHAQIGAAVDFWKVKMKPGKPLAFGWVTRDGREIPLFGLPGNPVSCLVNFAQFVRPWLRLTLGDPRPFLPVISAIAAEDLQEPPGRARLFRVTLRREGDAVRAWSAGSQSSGALHAMARSHGLLLVGPDAWGPKAGEACRIQLLDPGFLDGDTPDYGW